MCLECDLLQEESKFTSLCCQRRRLASCYGNSCYRVEAVRVEVGGGAWGAESKSQPPFLWHWANKLCKNRAVISYRNLSCLMSQVIVFCFAASCINSPSAPLLLLIPSSSSPPHPVFFFSSASLLLLLFLFPQPVSPSLSSYLPPLSIISNFPLPLQPPLLYPSSIFSFFPLPLLPPSPTPALFSSPFPLSLIHLLFLRLLFHSSTLLLLPSSPFFLPQTPPHLIPSSPPPLPSSPPATFPFSLHFSPPPSLFFLSPPPPPPHSSMLLPSSPPCAFPPVAILYCLSESNLPLRCHHR